MSDRTIHAVSPTGDLEVVRYDKAGRWYTEAADGSRRQVTIADAVEVALRLRARGGTIHLGRMGGLQFDAKVRSAS